MWKQGKRLVNGFESMIHDFGIEAKMVGMPVIPMLKFIYDDPEKNEKYRNIFFTDVIEKGIFLHPSYQWFLSLAHTDKDVDDTLNAAESGFSKIKKAIKRYS